MDLDLEPQQPQQPDQAGVHELLGGPQQQQDSQLLPGLTKLSILAQYVEYSPVTTPGLYQMTSLRHLDLRGTSVESVAQLAALSQLESLCCTV